LKAYEKQTHKHKKNRFASARSPQLKTQGWGKKATPIVAAARTVFFPFLSEGTFFLSLFRFLSTTFYHHLFLSLSINRAWRQQMPAGAAAKKNHQKKKKE
jgi:hypothetical protein